MVNRSKAATAGSALLLAAVSLATALWSACSAQTGVGSSGTPFSIATERRTDAVEMSNVDNTSGETVFLQRFGHAYRAYLEHDLEHARELLEELYALNPGFVPAATLLGRVSFFQQDGQRAIEVLESVLRREPNHIDAAKWLARGYLALDNLEAAERTIREAREVSSEDPELLLLLAQSALATGRFDRAVAATDQALAFRAALAEAALQIAIIYRSAGVTELGNKYLKAASQMSPTSLSDKTDGLFEEGDPW